MQPGASAADIVAVSLVDEMAREDAVPVAALVVHVVQ
jgi:hypothetical protein